MGKLRDALDTPWKARNELGRLLTYPWVRLFFATRGIRWEQGWKIYGTPIIMRHRRSRISFGPRLELRSTSYSNPLSPHHPVVLATWLPNAQLEIGSDFAITGGNLVAAEGIQIGNHVAVGANSTITDTDFHPLDPAARLVNHRVGATRPVIIEDHVFIGMNCLILKGVHIGAGAVIGAGSVVTRDVPAYTIVAGNPARPIRAITPASQA